MNDISNIKNKCIRNRLTYECKNMLPIYNNIQVLYDEINNITTVTIYKDSKKYTFKIAEDYPFRPPKIYYNNYSYAELLKMSGRAELLMLKKIKNRDCYCCASFCCSDNWTPTTTLTHIINEIKQMKKIKRDLINKMIADKIIAKYLINDINLDRWLF
jgi:ubiquitin-protein ligase